jgi:hypothetical protein
MRSAFAVSAIAAAVPFLALCADAGPTNREMTEEVKRGDSEDGDRQRSGSGIARLHNEVIALNASLITYMSQAVTSIGNDVELVHASILAAQLETVDTAAANRQAKSLIADLDALRQRAIADLTLPSDYTPPDVPPTALAGASTDLEPVLASTYQDLARLQHLFAALQAAALGLQEKLESIMAERENVSVRDMFEMQMLMNHLSQLAEMSSSILSAANTSIYSMVRNMK